MVEDEKNTADSPKTGPGMDHREFARQYQAIYPRLWLIATGIVGDRTEAEDIVQEAAVIAFRTTSRDAVGDVHVLEVAATMLVATVLSVLFAMLLTRFVEGPARHRIQAFYRSSRKTPINPE